MSEAMFVRITEVAQEARGLLARPERRMYGELAEAYKDYLATTGKSIEIGSREFVAAALSNFPRRADADVVASCYLRQRLQQEGLTEWPVVWHHGGYERAQHTYVLLGGLAIADITADQHGGPEVYVGPIEEPWRLWHDLV